MFARNAIAYLLAKANLGPTSVTIQTLDFSWSKFERFTSSVLQGASKLFNDRIPYQPAYSVSILNVC